MNRRKQSGRHRAQIPARTTTPATAAKCIISFAIAALIIGLLLTMTAAHKIAGGTTHKVNGAKDSAPASNHLTAPSAANTPSSASSSPLGGDGTQEKPAPSPCKAIELPGTQAAVTTLPLDEPLEGGGEASQDSQGASGGIIVTDPNTSAPQQRDRPAIEAMQSAVVEAETARERQAKINAITSYMVQYHGHPALIALAPLMVDTATATGMDCRMAPCTAAAESTCGSDPKAHGNLFGCQGGNSNSWPAQIIWYYNRIAELNAQHGWNNNWQIAYFWYGGGSPYGAGGVGSSAGYADNVIRDIQSIGW